MKIGISRPPAPPYPIPDVDGALVAQHAERMGFESIFYGEHPIRPVGQAGHSVHADGVPYFQDTLVTLARASAMTSTLKVGGGVFLIPQHNPVQFAKELATLDFYSGGRLLIGAGIGWSQVECEVLGGVWNRRWSQSREIVRIMKRLWTEDTVSVDGEFYTIPPVQLFPKPATDPWPPVLIGAAAGERTFRRVIEFGDGWLPAFVTEETIAAAPKTLESARSTLDRMAADAGRDPRTIQITAIIRGPQIDGDLGPGQSVCRDTVRGFGDAGADRVLISLPTITCEQDAVDALCRIANNVL